MANNSPTLVMASLSDDQLKKSINSLVTHVDEAMKKMVQSTNNAVGEMEAKLKSLGNLKIDSNGTNDGGASKRAKAQNAETDAIEKSIVARDKQIKKNQEVAMSFDRMANAQQVAIRSANPSGIRNADTLQTMNIQLDLLRERLREARQQYSSFVALAAHATTTGDKGLFQYATDGVHRYEQEVRNLIPQIRTLQSGIQQMGDVIAPQGHTIQNYVNSLQKANPELAALNAQYKSGTSLLQGQSTSYASATQSAQRYTEELKKQAAEIRKMPEWKQGKDIRVPTPSGWDAVVNSQKKLSLEEQLLKVYQTEEGTLGQLAQLEQSFESKEKERLGTERAITQEVEKQKKAYEKPASVTRSAVTSDMLRDFMASKLGVGINEIRNFDTTNASAKQLNELLKQLKDTYNKLTLAERNSPFGITLLRNMQAVQRQSQQLNAQLSRPVSLKDALSGSEKTLDDIAYKMQRLSSYRSGLNVETQKREIGQVNAEYDRLKKKMDEVMQKNRNMIASNTALGRSWNYMKNRLAFYVTVGATTAFINDMVRVRSEYEMNEKALGTLLNSAERGTRIFNELSNMALVSPYTLIELSTAAKQLTAYDVAAKDVVDTTRRLADISSAVGIPVERLTYALGQVKAYGHLTSQDARQFLNAGVPLVKELANRFSELEGKMVSTADVYDRMKKHAISYNDVLAVLTSMTDEGGRFFDYQAKTAETLKVRLANLTLAYNNMLNEIGKEEGGVFTSGIKSLTTLFKYWREISRVLATIIVSIGAYRAATLLAGIATTTAVGKNAFGAWMSLARGIKSAKDATALFSLTIKSIPFAGWVTAIASVVSYFVWFNNSSDETKQKLQDIATAFEGIRKEATGLFADAISTDSLGTQLTKLKDMLELAETELGITIPINLEDVNESNVKQKIRDVKNTIDNYLNFSQTFSEAAVDTRFNESMTNFGTTARSTYTSVTESINTVKVALQELVDAGKANKRDIEILKELDNKPKDGESRIEYFQRLVKLYEELGLIGKKEYIIPFADTELIDNTIALQSKQEASLDRLEIKNKDVFEKMLSDVQDYYSKSSFAAEQFEQQVGRVAKSINLEDIPISERTAKLEVAINQEAAKNNWNEFAIQYAKWVANQKFGLNIAISEESKKDSEIELSDWQKRMQAWADKHGITFSLNFMEKEDEKTYADRMLQAAKDAQGRLDVQRRKLGVGTGSQSAVDAATDEYKKARILALQAGADLSSLDKKTSSSRSSATKAESELAKTLKDELSTIDKVRSIYKELTKAGMSHANAVERATRGWDETVDAINRVLQKNGLQKLDLSKFVGVENPRELVNMLQSQLNTLVSRGAKPAEIKEFQAKINTLEVEADKYDLTMITKGLNSELGKLKEEYELAVELDANPELGGIFADMMGLDKEKLAQMPRDFNGVVVRMQKIIDDKLGVGKFNLVENLNKSVFDAWLKANKQGTPEDDAIAKSLESIIDYVNKIRLDSSKKQIEEWNKLLEKYAEYEYKRTQIQKEAEREREVARKKGANQNIINAINNREKQRYAQLDFEEFQKSSYWITATGDLANLSRSAIDILIQRLNTAKKSFKNLDAKQIKQLNSALSKLYKEQRKNNPFKAIGDMLQESKERVADFQREITETEQKIQRIEILKGMGDATEEQLKELPKLKKKWQELMKAQAAAEEIDASQWVAAINETIGAVKVAIGVFNDLAKAVAGVDSTVIDDVFSVVDKAGQGAAIGAQLGGYGAIVGAAVGAFTGLVEVLSGAEDKKITKQIEKSEQAVKRLELAYIDLQHAMDKAYGANIVGAKRAAAASKELQLAELKRQLALEKSRSSKKRDEDRIIELEKEIKELRYEIDETITSIVDDLLGSDVGSFAENLVSSMVDAFKQGEDYMKVFEEKFDDMIDSMIIKSITSRVVASYLDKLWENVKDRINVRTKTESDQWAAAQAASDELQNMTFTEWLRSKHYPDPDKWSDLYRGNELEELAKAFQAEKDAAKAAEKAAKDSLDAAQAVTDDDLAYVMEEIEKFKPELGERLKDILGAYYTFGQSSDKNLSALQQGLQSMSEDTAGALEAITNGISQQCYLQSDLLTQIRDAVVSMDMDISLSVMSQILLQLQSSYQIQQSMLLTMENWTNPSGNAVRVELIS